MKSRAFAASGLALSFLVLPVLAGRASAEERPKWELGVGGVFFTQPDYIGSDEYRFHALPFPWIIYRGERLRMDRESIQAKIFGTDLVRLDLSMSGQISVDSSHNDRRHGMPDLDWIAEVGPALKFKVFRSEDGRHSVDFEVPVRPAISVDFDHVAYQGVVSSPKFQYRFEPENWRVEANAGVEFNSNDYNEYVYGVPPRFATASRPAYGNEGGYAGLRLAAGVSRYFDTPVLGPLYVGLFARYYNLDGTTFRDSPLVGSNNAVVGGIAIGWVLMKSDEMVPVGAAANRDAAAEQRDQARPAPSADSPSPASPVPAPPPAP